MNACSSTVTIVPTSSRTPRIRRKGARFAPATSFFVALLLLCATSEQATAGTSMDAAVAVDTSAVATLLPTSASLGLNANVGNSGDVQLSLTTL